MDQAIRITGGRELNGEVVPIPNKNSIVSALPAAILTEEDVVYENVPKTSDVEKILQIMELLGASVDWREDRVVINCRGVNSYKIDKTLGSQFRGSLMFAGPLLARFGEAEIPMPGGCLLGYRSSAAHVDAFEKAGVDVTCDGDSLKLKRGRAKRRHQIWQYEASVTATENIAMYAAGIGDEIEIVDAAAEPHVSDVLKLLGKMGATIEGTGTNRLRIKGNARLKGAEFTPGMDFVDIAGYMAAVGMAGGKIRIKGANDFELTGGLRIWFSAFGLNVAEDGEDLVVKKDGGLRYRYDELGVPMAGLSLPKLAPRPWPGFPVDVIPVVAALACKTSGKLLLQNWMYESGFDFVRELNALGADIFMADPQKIIISGPVNFRGGEVSPPQVIQAVKAVFLAALADNVSTTIHGTDILRRRYPNIFETYKRLGADIEVVGAQPAKF